MHLAAEAICDFPLLLDVLADHLSQFIDSQRSVADDWLRWRFLVGHGLGKPLSHLISIAAGGPVINTTNVVL